MKIAIIIGAGPAGLTAAYKLLKTSNIKPVILEESDSIGGLCKNIYWNNNIIDCGGHRFFSKNDEINELWQSIMPLQGKPSKEEILTNYSTKLTKNGPDPEKEDNVLLMRTRKSRIYYLSKFFDYPLKINLNTIRSLGFIRTFKAGSCYIKSSIIKKKETNLENFYINRFGKYLYSTFFEGYTEKLWGRHPKDIDASWGKQRVKGLSLMKAIIHALSRPFRKDNQKVEGSLVESYSYPKLGPGSLYEKMAKEITNLGGEIYLNHKVMKINIENKKIVSLICNNDKLFKCDYIISSMPLKDLVNSFNNIDIPKEIFNIGNNLPYRDFISINFLLKDLLIHNKTKYRTINNRIPDTWLYIQQSDVKLGRVQILNNWSPYLCKDNNLTFIGLEYFVNEGNNFWLMKDDDLINTAIKDGEKINLFNKNMILESKVTRVKKAYPAYFDSYKDIDQLISYLNSIDNLYCIGRNGQHRYNNMDHSMLTALKCVECINNPKVDKKLIWQVNTKQEYCE